MFGSQRHGFSWAAIVCYIVDCSAKHFLIRFLKTNEKSKNSVLIIGNDFLILRK